MIKKFLIVIMIANFFLGSLFFAPPVFAWIIPTHNKMIEDAIAVLPKELSQMLNKVAVIKGVSSVERPWDMWNHIYYVQPFLGRFNLGGGPTKIEKLALRTRNMVKNKEPSEKVAYKMGQLAHYIADMNQPTHTVYKLPWLFLRLQRYELDFNKHNDDFQLSSFGELSRIDSFQRYAEKTAEWANQFYSPILSTYTTGGKFKDLEAINQVIYDHTVIDIANVWYSLW